MAASGYIQLQDTLGAPNLIGLIRTQASGIPNAIPPEFYTVSEQVEGDKATYYAAPGQRKVPRSTPYGGTPRNHQTLPIAEQSLKMVHFYEEMNLQALGFQSLLNYDDLSKQRFGIREVNRHVKDFKQKFANARIAMMALSLFAGKVSFDADGNLLGPSENVPAGGYTLDWLVPDGVNGSPWGITVSGVQSSNRMDGTGTQSSGHAWIDPVASGTGVMGNSAALAWSNPTNDIPTQFLMLEKAASYQHGIPLKHVFYGANIPKWLTSNVKMQNFMHTNVTIVNAPGSGPSFLKDGQIPDGTLGYTWHNASPMFFDDQNGVHQALIGDNQIVITPDYADGGELSWLKNVEGSFTVPLGVWTTATRENPGLDTPFDAMGPFEIVYGMFSYSLPTMKPPTATLLFGDTFVTIPQNPSVYYIITVA